jgi:MFS family permease
MPQLYHRKTTSPRLTLAVLATVVAAFSMLQSLVTPALPVMQHDLHTSASTVTWVFTALLLSVSVATPLLGRIGDMVGKERTLLIGLVALAVGCLLAALAPNIGVLIAARVIQGLGGAVFPLWSASCRPSSPPAADSASCWPGRLSRRWAGAGCSGSR